tara:strand:+ start:3428 stop:3634 length:207 start_codon:yes stop_codon:yes gene_type:complete
MAMPTIGQLQSILSDIEELVGMSLGKAPSDQYTEDLKGRKAIALEDARLYAQLADGAYARLQTIIRGM